MGGFGSLDIARLNPGRFCAVGAHSPAIWHTGGETAPGAFDDSADFEHHDVLQAATDAPGPYLGLPVWMDTGDEDPFRHTGLDEFAEQLRRTARTSRSTSGPGRTAAITGAATGATTCASTPARWPAATAEKRAAASQYAEPGSTARCLVLRRF